MSKASDQIFHAEEFGQPTIVEQLRAELASQARTIEALRAELAEANRKLRIIEGHKDPRIEAAAGEPCDLLEVASGLHDVRRALKEHPNG